MAQSDFGTINPNTKSGTDLASDLNNFRDAVNSNHSGTSRPAYATAGMTWVNTTSNPWIYYLHDGTDDIKIGELNVTTNVFTPEQAAIGPASATDNAIARFDGTTGKLLQNSAVTVDDSGNVSGVGNINGTSVSSLLDSTDLGVTVQAYDADLATIAGLTPTEGQTLLYSGGAWTVGTADGTDQAARDMAASALAYTIAQNDATSITGSIGRFRLSNGFEADSLATKTNATYDATGDYYSNPASTLQIPQATGTAIGDMTAGGGLAAAFDGNTAQDSSTASRSANGVDTAYIGKNYSAAPKAVSQATVYKSTVEEYNTNLGTVTFTLYGKNGTAPATSSDGTSLGTATSTEAAPATSPLDIPSSGTATTYDYIWVELSGISGNTYYVSEVEFYEAVDPPDMTLAPTAATLDTASPGDVVGYFVFDPQEPVTYGTDIIGKISVDGGTTKAIGTWTKVGDIGSAGEELYRLSADVSAQTGSSLVYEITTANNKEVRYHACIGLVPLY